MINNLKDLTRYSRIKIYLSSKWQSTYMTLYYYKYFMKGLYV